MQVEIGEMRIECRLVTDPDTLLPYHYDQSTRQSMRMIEKDLTTEFRVQDDLEIVYSYGDMTRSSCRSAGIRTSLHRVMTE